MSLQKLYGIWKLYDVPGWQKWFGAAVLGFALELAENYSFSIYELQGLVIGIPSILCFNQSINDYFDVDVDRAKENITGKKRVIDRVISRRVAAVLTVLSLVVGLISAWLTSLSLFVLIVFMAALGTVYSAPPFRLKMKYPFSTLIQFVGCFIPFLAGTAALAVVDNRSLLISSVFGLLAMVHRFSHEIHFRQADLKTGKMTVAVVKGMKTARILRVAFLVGGIAEFAVFFMYGLVPVSLMLLFLFYVFICIENPLWFNRLPNALKRILNPLITIPGFVLLPIAVYLSGII